MNLRTFLLRLTCLAGLLGTCPAAQAQQPTPPAATDVLLLTNGQEVSGRVLTITPTELTYRPAPDSANPAGTSDTLHLPVNSIFLIRYANGTRAVLTPAAQARDSVQSPLLGLNFEQRRQLGAQHAHRYYHQSGPFWGAFASAVVLSPIYGAVPTACISLKHVAPRNLLAPQPQLLRDEAYAGGYKQQANRKKSGRAWAGYGVGSATYLAFIAVIFIGLASGL